MNEIDNGTMLAEIEQCMDENARNVERLMQLCKDRDPEVRWRALESLGDIITPEVKECVYAALSDPDELVTVASLEILEKWKDSGPANVIVDLLSDDRELVRSAAAVTVGMIGISNAESKLIERLNSCDEKEKVAVYFALCKLGQAEYFHFFLNGIFHSSYVVRCATANLVTEMTNENNRVFLVNLLTEVWKNEKTEAAKSSIANAIEVIGRVQT